MAWHGELPYGQGCMPLDLPGEPLVLLPGRCEALPCPTEAVRAALRRPAGTPPLARMLRERKPRRVTVVVNDETRPTPYAAFFPPLLEAFAEAGVPDRSVIFVVATGIHAPQSDALNRKLYGAAMTERFRFVSHDADDAGALTRVGRLASGIELDVNRLAVETDFLITLGVVAPHYFAGFSGGRKSILPGLAGRDAVTRNHARMVEIMDRMPPLRCNPVSLEMLEAARMVGVDFLLNAVPGPDGEWTAVAAGDLEQAWLQAVEHSSRLFEIPFGEPVDLCVAAACGYPRDLNLYQAQKALDHADRVTRAGGSIVLVAECREGYGDPTFEAWMREGARPENIMERVRSAFVLGGHKAYGFAKVAARKKLTLVTSLDATCCATLFADKAPDAQSAVDAALRAHPGASVAVLPRGSLTLPVGR